MYLSTNGIFVLQRPVPDNFSPLLRPFFNWKIVYIKRVVISQNVTKRKILARVNQEIMQGNTREIARRFAERTLLKNALLGAPLSQ